MLVLGVGRGRALRTSRTAGPADPAHLVRVGEQDESVALGHLVLELLDAVLAKLDDAERDMISRLACGLDDHWSLEGLTTLVYGVPKLHRGLPIDVQPTAELKIAQRRFFALLYRLLVGCDTGPRLPTLLLAAGPDRIRHLLASPKSTERASDDARW